MKRRPISLFAFLSLAATACGGGTVDDAYDNMTLTTEAELTAGRQGVPYEAKLEVQGGKPDALGYRWTVVKGSGSLPLNTYLSMRGMVGRITGTPTANGESTFKVRVEDSLGHRVEKEFTLKIEVKPSGVQILTRNIAAGRMGVEYNQAVVGVGGSDTGYRWAITEGSLPPGLSLQAEGTPETRITGTPTELGNFPFAIELTDSAGNKSRQTYAISISKQLIALAIEPSELPEGFAKIPYSARLTVKGGSGEGYKWAIHGTLPEGLTLDATDDVATIAGVHEFNGSYSFAVQVVDSAGTSVQKDYTLFLDETPKRLVITTPIVPQATIHEDYEVELRSIQGNEKDYVWTVHQGSLPPGLTLDREGTPASRIHGRPTEAGTFEFTVQVKDSAGARATMRYSLVVLAPPVPLAIRAQTLSTGHIGHAYHEEILIVGGTAPYGVRLLNEDGSGPGTLPSGLAIAQVVTSSIVRIEGYPLESTTANFQIQVYDQENANVSQPFSLTVDNAEPIPLAITTPSLSFEGCRPFSTIIEANGGNHHNYTWSVTAGQLPLNTSLRAQGTPSTAIVGTPPSGVNFDFTVEVRDSASNTASHRFQGTTGSFRPGFVTGFAEVSGPRDQLFAKRVCEAADVQTPLIALSEQPNTYSQEVGKKDVEFSSNGRWISYLYRPNGAATKKHAYLVDLADPSGPSYAEIGNVSTYGSVAGTAISPDSKFLAYYGEVPNAMSQSLWITSLNVANPASAGHQIQVPGGTENFTVKLFQWAPTGSRFAMLATTPDDALRSKLYVGSVNDDGSLDTLYGPVTGYDLNTSLTNFVWGPRPDKIYFPAQDTRPDTSTDPVVNFYEWTVQAANLSARAITTTGKLVDSGKRWTDDQERRSWGVTRDGQRFLWIDRQGTGIALNMRTLGPALGNVQTLSDIPTYNSYSRKISGFVSSPDGSMVAILQDASDSGRDLVVWVPLATPTDKIIIWDEDATGTGADPSDDRGVRLKWTPDSTMMVFRGSYKTSIDELQVIKVSDLRNAGTVTEVAATAIRTVGAPTAALYLSEFELSPDGGSVLMRTTGSSSDQYTITRIPYIVRLADLPATTPAASVDRVAGIAQPIPPPTNPAAPGWLHHIKKDFYWDHDSRHVYVTAEDLLDDDVNRLVRLDTGTAGASGVAPSAISLTPDLENSKRDMTELFMPYPPMLVPGP